MKNSITVSAEISPYRTFEEELEIYNNDIDYVWKLDGNFVYCKEKDCYLGEVTFNDLPFTGILVKTDMGLFCTILNDNESYTFAVSGTKKIDNLTIAENSKNLKNELGFGNYVYSEDNIDQNLVKDKLDEILKNYKISKIVDKYNISNKNDKIVKIANDEIDLINLNKFSVYDKRGRLFVEKIGLFDVIYSASLKANDYIKNQMLVNNGEEFKITQEFLDFIVKTTSETIDMANPKIKENPAQKQFLEAFCSDMVGGVLKNNLSLGFLLANIISGSNDIRDIAIEDPLSLYIIDLGSLTKQSDFKWLISAYEDMDNIENENPQKGQILLDAISANKGEIDNLDDYLEGFSVFEVLKSNLKENSSSLANSLYECVDLYSKLCQEEAENQKTKIS